MRINDKAPRRSAAVDAAVIDMATVSREWSREYTYWVRLFPGRAGPLVSWELDIFASRARGRSVVVHSKPPRTAVCVLRVEDRGSGGFLITVTMTLDIAASPRSSTRRVTGSAEALSLVASFLRDYAAGEDPGPNVS